MEGRLSPKVSKYKSSSWSTKKKSDRAHFTPSCPNESGGELGREEEGVIEGAILTLRLKVPKSHPGALVC